jgi:MFS family permease
LLSNTNSDLRSSKNDGGLLIGILLARTIAGMVGGIWGWRTMYFIAAVGMGFLAVVLALVLPRSHP